MIWGSTKVSHKTELALLTPEELQLDMAKMLQKSVFALPGCRPISVNTLLCDTLGLADDISFCKTPSYLVPHQTGLLGV